MVLPEPVVASSGPGDVPVFERCPGLVVFTSGSTGLPRPVYRTTSALIRDAAARLAVLHVPAKAGIIGTLPLFRSYGLTASVLCASMLGSSLALLERFDHRALLALFATREYHVWREVPKHIEDLRIAPAPEPGERVLKMTGRAKIDGLLESQEAVLPYAGCGGWI